ncbi:MAG: TMEM175 family protein [Bacteroidota bacterium]
MNKSRLEAFSDGVLAIIITIMVLEIKIPQSSEWSELRHLIPIFVSYMLSFLYVGIYWGNHHHLLHSVKHVTSGILLANLNLLFWLSLIPFATGWMGENHFAPNTVAVYGSVLLLSALGFFVLMKMVEKHAHDIDQLRKAFVLLNKKGIISTIGYFLSIPLAFVHPGISGIIYVVNTIVWLIPDRNIERALKGEQH